MWICKLCHVSFAFESVEQHVYRNHLKPNVGRIKVYNCGGCMFTAEGFEDIALHCINRGHEPTRVNKGLDYDQYASQVFTALEECVMYLNKSSVLLDTSTFASTFPTTDPSASSERATPISNIDWSEPTERFRWPNLSDFGKSNLSSDLGASTGNELETKDEGNKNRYDVDNNNQPKFEPPELTDASPSPTVGQSAIPGQATTPKTSSTGSKRVSSEGSEQGSATKRAARLDGGNTESPSPSNVVTDDNFRRKTFPCAYCPKSSPTASAGKVHERIHTGEKPFECQTCGKSFADAGNLAKHGRVHTGEKPFPCLTCGQSFRVKFSLDVHTRTHSGDQPFGCTTCGKSFNQRNNLTTHERTHSGEKPFSCPTCGKGFTQSGHLKTHEKSCS